MNKHKSLLLKAIILLLVAGFVLVMGRRLVKDYGVSRDERAERESLLVNANYVAGLMGKEVDEDIKPLETFKDRYYGMAAQFPMIIFERFADTNFRHMFLLRHLYTFFLCCIGYLAFYFFCKKVFGSRAYGALGAAMVALYPRFFAEQFYNIKDMVFLSIFMMMLLVTYLFVESGYKWGYCILFTFMCAFATNVRIMGGIFGACVLGYMWMMYAYEKIGKKEPTHSAGKLAALSAVILIGTVVVLVALTPILWHDPIHELPAMFRHFLNYDGWNGELVFMGKVINKTQIPWYYVPVWLLISLPIWYLVVLFVAAGLFIYLVVKAVAKKEDLFTKFFVNNKYVTLAVVTGFLPWLMVAVTGATIYNGWRHLYFIFPAIVVAILWTVRRFLMSGGAMKKLSLALVTVGMLTQVIWICRYHPYEFVYFNEVGSLFADQFDRDYWTLCELPAYRYLKEVNEEYTGRDYFFMHTEGAAYFEYVLEEEELAKMNTYNEDPDYYVAYYRGVVGNEYEVEGFTEIKTIEVNGFKVASIYAKDEYVK